MSSFKLVARYLLIPKPDRANIHIFALGWPGSDSSLPARTFVYRRRGDEVLCRSTFSTFEGLRLQHSAPLAREKRVPLHDGMTPLDVTRQCPQLMGALALNETKEIANVFADMGRGKDASGDLTGWHAQIYNAARQLGPIDALKLLFRAEKDHENGPKVALDPQALRNVARNAANRVRVSQSTVNELSSNPLFGDWA